MSIFGLTGTNDSKTINNISVTQSTQGYPIPTVMGQAKIHTSLLFKGPVFEQKVQGGKGGGKGTSSYFYYSTVMAALCNGEVISIGNVWSNQSWLSTQGSNEGIVISQHYSPSNAAVLIADNGVTLANTYSATYNDYGQPAATVLSGTDNSPMVLVPYDYTESLADNSAELTTGQYSISNGIGSFALTAAANASGGNTVYTGTITGGASNGLVGFRFTAAGFVAHPQNNGIFVCVASSATTVTLANPSGVAETHAATITDLGTTYHFSASDAGKSAVVWYQFNYSLLEQQDIEVIPTSSVIGGSTIPYAVQVSNQYDPASDIGVQYYGQSNPKVGQSLLRVTVTPTVTGTYRFFHTIVGGNAYTYYQFAPGDLGNEVLITWGYTNQSAVGQTAPELINFEMFGGAQGQAAWPFLITGGIWALGGGSSNVASGYIPGDPGQSLAYTGVAYIAYSPMFLGSSGQTQDNLFEVLTPDAFGGGITDCNPVTCIYRVLTDKMWGLGSGLVPFPLAAIDNGASGTWGGPVGTPGTRSVSSTAWNWFAGNNFFISPAIDSHSSAASVISEWLEAGACAAFMSEGLLKLVPYGSTSVAANGCTWVGPQNFIVALDDSCFVTPEGTDPVKVTRSAWQDAINSVQIGFSNRANQYENDVCQDSDQAAINRFGLRREDPKHFDFIRTITSAMFAASMRVKRATSIRNTLKFTVPYSYSYLEPMDVITITCSSIWAAGLNNSVGVVNLPVRITKTVDDPERGIEITCEDYQALASEPVLFNKDISGGSVPVNQWVQPGNAEVVMFEATNRLTQQQGNEIWIGACGTTANYGGCNVWVSEDGSNYLMVGTIKAAARLGVLFSPLASGSDPDTTNTMAVELVENSAPLDAGSHADADSGTTLCFVDGELISYSDCTADGNNVYSMGSYLRRGQMGSVIGAHAAGALFMRLDQNVFKYTYDPTWAGKTLYFKFQAFNLFQNNAQLLSSLTALAFTVPGLNPGTIDASTGLVVNTPPSTNVVNAVTPVTGTNTSPQSGNVVVGTGWIVGQVYSNGGIVDIFLECGSAVIGYLFRVDFRSGFPSLIGAVSALSTVGFALVTLAHGANNAAAITGWRNFSIYIGAGGFMSLWIDGAFVCQVTDTRYPIGDPSGQQLLFFMEAWGSSSVWQIGPSAVAPGAGSSGLNGQGSVVPTQPIPDPSYTTTSTTISLTWPAQSMLLSDGSSISIPSGSKSYSGLSASTSYYLYPYVRVSDYTYQFANGSPPPTAPNAAAAIAAASDGTWPVAPIVITTPTTGGGGSGGGGGRCPEASELVRERERGDIPVSDVRVNDYILGHSFHSGKDVYRRVISTGSAPCAAWRIIDGHKVTPCEPVWDGQFTPAFKVTGAKFDGSVGTKILLHVDTDDYEECNYFLVSGLRLLIHNAFIIS